MEILLRPWTKLWITIIGIDGRAKREADKVAITFNGSSFSSSKQLTARFNQQFNTSKLGRNTFSSETRLVTRETKRKSLEMAQTLITDLVRSAIKSCRNSKAFGPNKLSIFHLKNLGPRAIEYITTLFNLSVTTCQIPAIWKSSLIIPIPNFVSADLASMASRESTGVSDSVSLSTNISNMLQTKPVLDQITRPPQLYCR